MGPEKGLQGARSVFDDILPDNDAITRVVRPETGGGNEELGAHPTFPGHSECGRAYRGHDVSLDEGLREEVGQCEISDLDLVLKALAFQQVPKDNVVDRARGRRANDSTPKLPECHRHVSAEIPERLGSAQSDNDRPLHVSARHASNGDAPGDPNHGRGQPDVSHVETAFSERLHHGGPCVKEFPLRLNRSPPPLRGHEEEGGVVKGR